MLKVLVLFTLIFFQMPKELLRNLLVFLEKASKPETGKRWMDEFDKFVKGQFCWFVYLRLILEDVSLFVGPTRGRKTIYEVPADLRYIIDRESFEKYRDPSLCTRPRTRLACVELNMSGRLMEIFGGVDLDAITLTQEQILDFLFTYSSLDTKPKVILSGPEHGTFLFFTDKDEPVNTEDFSNLNAIYVYFDHGSRLHISHVPFTRSFVWIARKNHPYRFVVPYEAKYQLRVTPS